jgi:DNA-binding IclR family transcriptional regulator
MAGDRVEAVERALDLLEAFSDDQNIMTLKDLSEATGFYKSTILRLAGSLIRYQYLMRREDGSYQIGPALLRLGEIFRYNFDSSEVVRPVLRELSRQFNESAAFYIKHEDLRICLYRANANRAIRHEIKEGAQLSLKRGASGRILLAYSGGSDKVSEIIRTQGWYLSEGERDPDVAALSVPVFSPKQKLLGALSISGLRSRFTSEFIEKSLPYLIEKTHELGNTLY